MAVLYFTSFCCCLKLKIGTLLIAFVHSFTALAVVVYCSSLANQFLEYISIGGDYDGVYRRDLVFLCITVAAGVLHLLLGVMLLYGTVKGIPILIRVWVLLMTILLVAAVSFLIVYCAVYGIKGQKDDIVLQVLEVLCFFAYTTYAIACVNSYWLKLKYGEDLDGTEIK